MYDFQEAKSQFKYKLAMSSIPEPIRDVKPKYTQLFINNEWHNSASGKTFETKNPATLQVNATIQVTLYCFV